MPGKEKTGSARDRLLESLAMASREMEQMKAGWNMGYDDLYSRLRGYILARFLLDRDEAGSMDGLLELAEAGIAKTMSVDREELAGMDLSSSCTGSSSVVTKKVLLLLSIEKELDIDFSPGESVNITTVSGLAESIFQKLEQKSLTLMKEDEHG